MKRNSARWPMSTSEYRIAPALLPASVPCASVNLVALEHARREAFRVRDPLAARWDRCRRAPRTRNIRIAGCLGGVRVLAVNQRRRGRRRRLAERSVHRLRPRCVWTAMGHQIRTVLVQTDQAEAPAVPQTRAVLDEGVVALLRKGRARARGV